MASNRGAQSGDQPDHQDVTERKEKFVRDLRNIYNEIVMIHEEIATDKRRVEEKYTALMDPACLKLSNLKAEFLAFKREQHDNEHELSEDENEGEEDGDGEYRESDGSVSDAESMKGKKQQGTAAPRQSARITKAKKDNKIKTVEARRTSELDSLGTVPETRNKRVLKVPNYRERSTSLELSQEEAEHEQDTRKRQVEKLNNEESSDDEELQFPSVGSRRNQRRKTIAKSRVITSDSDVEKETGAIAESSKTVLTGEAGPQIPTGISLSSALRDKGVATVLQDRQYAFLPDTAFKKINAKVLMAATSKYVGNRKLLILCDPSGQFFVPENSTGGHRDLRSWFYAMKDGKFTMTDGTEVKIDGMMLVNVEPTTDEIRTTHITSESKNDDDAENGSYLGSEDAATILGSRPYIFISETSLKQGPDSTAAILKATSKFQGSEKLLLRVNNSGYFVIPENSGRGRRELRRWFCVMKDRRFTGIDTQVTLSGMVLVNAEATSGDIRNSRIAAGQIGRRAPQKRASGSSKESSAKRGRFKK